MNKTLKEIIENMPKDILINSFETVYEDSIKKDLEIERLNNIKKKAINELFNLKDMIYKPETREINFDIQNKISSIIKILGSDKE